MDIILTWHEGIGDYFNEILWQKKGTILIPGNEEPARHLPGS